MAAPLPPAAPEIVERCNLWGGIRKVLWSDAVICLISNFKCLNALAPFLVCLAFELIPFKSILPAAVAFAIPQSSPMLAIANVLPLKSTALISILVSPDILC